MAPRKDDAVAQFNRMISGHEQALDDRASEFRLRPTPQQGKAEETSRVARELTEAANEQRFATAARLRAARLEKDAENRSDAEPD